MKKLTYSEAITVSGGEQCYTADGGDIYTVKDSSTGSVIVSGTVKESTVGMKPCESEMPKQYYDRYYG